MSDILWQPSAEHIAAAPMTAFHHHAAEHHGAPRPGSADAGDPYSALHAWSIADPGRFWTALWQFCQVIGSPGAVGCSPGDLASPFGVLDFFDVIAYLDLFATQDPAADLDDNGVFDFFDVLDYLGFFDAGCD
ncbi:MAG: GC-type dockerin domain-anchored protein [Myxococcota bacterium]